MPSGLEATIDEVIRGLLELRGSRIVRQQSRINEDDPDDLRDLAALTIDAAKVIDPLFHEIAYQGGLSSRSGASEHARFVTDAIEGDLDYELTASAEKSKKSEPQIAGPSTHSAPGAPSIMCRGFDHAR